VYLTLKPLALALEPVPFGPDLLQSATTLIEVRGSLCVRWHGEYGENRKHAERVGKEAGEEDRHRTPEQDGQQDTACPLTRFPTYCPTHA
jgi:hypothetical protein